MTGPEKQRLVDTGYRQGLERAVKELLDYKPADDDPGLPSWLHAYNAIAHLADIARCPDCDFGGLNAPDDDYGDLQFLLCTHPNIEHWETP